MAGQPFLERPQEASIVERIHMHTNQVRKRQHSGSSQRRQPAGSSSNAVYVEATSRATYQKGIGVFETTFPEQQT